MSDFDDLFSVDDGLEGDDETSLSDFDFPKDLSQIASEQLCDVVIAYQYLGIVADYAILCMKELAFRRAEGDPFNFEEYIANELKKLPNLSAQQPFLSNIFRSQ